MNSSVTCVPKGDPGSTGTYHTRGVMTADSPWGKKGARWKAIFVFWVTERYFRGWSVRGQDIIASFRPQLGMRTLFRLNIRDTYGKLHSPLVMPFVWLLIDSADMTA